MTLDPTEKLPAKDMHVDLASPDVRLEVTLAEKDHWSALQLLDLTASGPAERTRSYSTGLGRMAELARKVCARAPGILRVFQGAVGSS